MKKLVLAVIMLAFSVGVNAACDKKSLKGYYAFSFTSSNAAPSSNANSCVVLGTVFFDGKGGQNSIFSQGCGAEFGTQTNNGTYDVFANCIGFIDYPNGISANFVMDRAFKGGSLILSQGGSIAIGSIFKQ